MFRSTKFDIYYLVENLLIISTSLYQESFNKSPKKRKLAAAANKEPKPPKLAKSEPKAPKKVKAEKMAGIAKMQPLALMPSQNGAAIHSSVAPGRERSCPWCSKTIKVR